MHIDWNNVMQVRVKEHLYTEFKQAARVFATNKAKYIGKYIPKVWDINQCFVDSFVTLDGIAGAFNTNLFYALKVQDESNIIKRAIQMHHTSPKSHAWDTHAQSVNWVFHKEADLENVNPIDIIEDENIPDESVRTAEDEACYSEMSERFGKFINAGFDTITGYFYLDSNLTGDRAERWLKMCRVWGMLSDKVETKYIDNKNYKPHILYRLHFEKGNRVRYDKLYFQFSLIRFVLEYHGTLNVMFDMMEEFKLNMPLALMLSMLAQRNHRYLHVPFDLNSEPLKMETAVKYANAIVVFNAGSGIFDRLVKGFNTFEAIYALTRNNRNTAARKCTDAKPVKQLNELVIGGK